MPDDQFRPQPPPPNEYQLLAQIVNQLTTFNATMTKLEETMSSIDSSLKTIAEKIKYPAVALDVQHAPPVNRT